MKESKRYILGYLVGFSLFIVLIPLGLFGLSKFDYVFKGKELIASQTLRYILFATFFIVGAIFAAWSNVFLFKVGKGGPTDAFGISISPQTKKLVTTGPYKYSRNPMVFGAFSLYTSIVIILNSIVGIIALTFILLLAILFLKMSEERRLIKDFGNEYLDYRNRVSMIFPVKFKKHNT